MHINRLRSLWADGRATLGAIATIPSVQTVQMMTQSGLDWILIDSSLNTRLLGASRHPNV